MKKIKYCGLIVLGIIEIWIVLDHIIQFTPHDYFYIQHPDITKYVGTNVVSRFADLTFLHIIQ